MITRRRFVAWVAGAVPVAIVTRRAEALGTRWVLGEAEVLRAIAEAALPSELGATGAARVAADFQRWINGYRENVERVHGYGTSALQVTGPSPRARWAAQLERLGTRGFERLSVDERRAMIREELKDVNTERMPSVVGAPHVVLAILAHYYGSSAAADLCYEAQIGRQTCRPLSQASRKPLPLAGAR